MSGTKSNGFKYMQGRPRRINLPSQRLVDSKISIKDTDFLTGIKLSVLQLMHVYFSQK